MKNVLLALVVLASLGSSRPGCGPYKPERDQGEGEKHKVSEVCAKLSGECGFHCYRRQASDNCSECCITNFNLCDYGEPYDFAPCERIDPAPALPNGGTGDAGALR